MQAGEVCMKVVWGSGVIARVGFFCARCEPRENGAKQGIRSRHVRKLTVMFEL